MRMVCVLLLICLNTAGYARQSSYGAEVSYNPEGSTEYTCAELTDKVRGFSRMRNAGIGLMVGGVALGGIGAAMISSADGVTYYENVNGHESGNATGGFGAVFVMFAIPLTIAGAVLTPIGIGKSISYNRMKAGNKCVLELKMHPNAVELSMGF